MQRSLIWLAVEGGVGSEDGIRLLKKEAAARYEEACTAKNKSHRS